MALRAFQAANLEELNFTLTGGVRGGELPTTVYGIAGKTLTISSPSALTCTFAPGTDQLAFTMKQIVDAINVSAIGAVVTAKYTRGALVLTEKTPSSGVQINPAGTATSVLKFGPSKGLVYAAPGGTAPALVSVTPLFSSTFLVVVNEA